MWKLSNCAKPWKFPLSLQMQSDSTFKRLLRASGLGEEKDWEFASDVVIRFVEGQQRCVQCEGPVLTRELFLFPCQHVLHADCLANLMLEEFDDVQRKRYNMLSQQIRDLEQAVAKVWE